jgi:hypothetical protein
MFDKKLAVAFSLVFANVLTGPLAQELEDVFGTALVYHPVTVWVILLSIVYVNTDSLGTAIILVVMYEVIKAVWKIYRPETPRVAMMRRVLHAVQAGKDMSEEDIACIDRLTPVTVSWIRTSPKIETDRQAV